MVVVIDYGVGNLGSVLNMLKKVGVPCKVSSCEDEILAANKVILPGVGSFDHGMMRLRESGVAEILKEKATHDNSEIMGICLGMQLLTDGSEEGNLAGLGLISGYARRFTSDVTRKLKVPHMGWNIVYPFKEHYLVNNLPEESRFYFVHSYFVECTEREDVLLTSNYGVEFVSSFQRGNIIGCQFHPEKSHRFGIKLFENFTREPVKETSC